MTRHMSAPVGFFLTVLSMFCGSMTVALGQVAPKFQVNTTTSGRQTNSSVAELTNDGFVVAWYDGSRFSVITRRFDSSGVAVGAETVLLGFTNYESDVAALPGGGYVLVAKRIQPTEDLIVAQRYAADGTTLGDTLQVNTRTAGYQRRPAVAVLSDGGFVVTWESVPNRHPAQGDGSGSGVYAQRYDAGGSPAGSEFRVNTYTAGDQGGPDVAALAGGGFVIVWSDEEQGAVYGRRYAANGSPIGAFLVQTGNLKADSQNSFGPKVATLINGGFVVALRTSDRSFARLYDAGGAAQGAAFGVIGASAIAGLANGGFVVAFATNFITDPNSYEIFGAKYDAGGAQDGPGTYFVYESNDQVYPALAALDEGFVATWNDQDIFGRIFAGAPGTITGTSGPDNLFGTTGDDTIDGRAGADVMTGLAGNDLYYVQDPGDVVVEVVGEGTDTVKSAITYALPVNVEKLILMGGLAINGTGNSLANTLTGNAAANTLNGGPGNDTLVGRAGPDRFLFKTAPNSSTNFDRITDFSVVEDVIRLENSVFTGLPATGTLAAAAFATGTAATTATHRIIYDPATGNVRYDADGVGGAAAVRFARLTTKPAVTRLDFYVQ